MTGWRPALGPSSEEVVERLATADLTVEGRMPWSSNLTFLVALDPPGTTAADDQVPESGPAPGTDRRGGVLGAIYKPLRGERDLWDFPDGLYRREAAAWVLAEALGWDIVPHTLVREDGPFGVGSVQIFVEAEYDRHYFTLLEEGGHESVLRAFCAFDVVANNADRKSGHVLADPDGGLWGIDQGLCFHPGHKLRTVIWDFAGEPVPPSLLADLARVAGALPPALDDLLTGRELEALVRRMERLVQRGEFPEPVGDHPPYPWPLV